MSMPTCSVILPNYNHAQFLPRQLTALLAQSVPPLEIIVVDDASTDNSVEVIERFAREHASVRLIRSETNQGVVAGMNRGTELARGDYVLFAAADDEVLPGLLEKSLRLLAQHPRAALCCTIGDWREERTGLRWMMGVGMADAPCFLAPEQMVALEKRGRLYIASHTAVIRRSALIEVGKWLPELKWYCDWFAIYCAAFRHGICHVPEPLAAFNIHEASFYTSGRRTPAAHREVLENLLRHLNRPEFRDAEERIRASGAMYQFAWPLLKLLLSRREYRRYLTAPFVRKNVLHIFRLLMKRVLPAWLGNLYLRLFFHAKPTPA